MLCKLVIVIIFLAHSTSSMHIYAFLGLQFFYGNKIIAHLKKCKKKLFMNTKEQNDYKILKYRRLISATPWLPVTCRLDDVQKPRWQTLWHVFRRRTTSHVLLPSGNTLTTRN